MKTRDMKEWKENPYGVMHGSAKRSHNVGIKIIVSS